MLTELKSLLNEYELISVTEDNYVDLWGIYETNRDYLATEEDLVGKGREASPEDILALAVNRPPGFDPKGKFCVGIWREGKPIAILDYLVGTPKAHIAYLSLLIVHGDYKRQSIGTTVVNAFIDAARECGYTEVGLGINDENEGARAFWGKVGLGKGFYSI
ncbi:MAG: GNAT family N-acetyltransferase [Defluviitaleaceae bacterium]|nr:GNAT family N-acetyltransferase [Defluviitaleaceae bacterium]